MKSSKNFENLNNLKPYKFTDYTVLCDFDLNPYIHYFPTDLKIALESRWCYYIHISPVHITRKTLKQRVNGGIILAYQYCDDFSISGNEVSYIGFIPSSNKINVENTHSKCYITSQKIWMRELKLVITLASSCPCSENCIQCNIRDLDLNIVQCCIKKIDFSKIYIHMGDVDKNCIESIIKKPRACVVCGKCPKCAINVNYCNTHKKCNHKTTKIDELTSLYNLQFKSNIQVKF